MASIGRSSMLLASGTVASRILGFVKVIALTYAIGQIGLAANSFQAGNQLPNNVYVIIAGGVLNAVLVPQIVRAAMHKDGGSGYINKLVTVAIVILGVTTIAATLIAPFLVTISVSHFSHNQYLLAVGFAYWCLPQIFFYGLYSVLGEILNARNSFGPFTWAPLVNNIVSIIGILLFIVMFGADRAGTRGFDAWTPQMIAVLGGTATLGVACQAFILFFFWRRIGLSYRPDFHWRGVGLGTAGKLAGWTFGMLLVTQAAGLVDTNVMSLATNKDASLAVLANSWLIFMLPHSIVTVSIATVYFTRMAEHASAQRFDGLKTDLSASVRTISLLIAISSAVLIVVAYPFASFFSANYRETIDMGNVIIAYVIGLLPFSLVFLFQRTFYALNDTRTPFLFTVVQAALFSAAAVLCGIFLPTSLLAAGIAVSMTISTAVQAVVAVYLLRRRLGRLDLRRILISLARYTLGLIPALAAGLFLLYALGGARDGGFALSGVVSAAFSMALIGFVMLLVYLLTLRLVRTPELADALAPFAGRLRGRRPGRERGRHSTRNHTPGSE
ncbi:murein biosynthesis integral membrane protein MurJ [Rathayibacter soli]|uniref:murein biosynthesis integral membrane protein MurJ n=1 Tax=Rathayibacter soli TaxID=3144168 RepID=UPI0027E4726A|nr:murein biosynthesis integral membrane protein MurJ [Glaciibacter superstes]